MIYHQAAQFLKLTKILDLLSDTTQRKSYDAKVAARKYQKKRKLESDAKTRGFRDGKTPDIYFAHLRKALEEREERLKKQRQEGEKDQIDLNAEIQRLREEGLRRIEEENRRREKELEMARKEQIKKESQVIVSCENTSEQPSEARLRSILQGYGNLIDLLMVNNKAIAEFDRPESAVCFHNPHLSYSFHSG